MALKPQIRDFIKKILILSLVLSFFINLLVLAVSSDGGDTADAEENATRFARAGSDYLGSTGVALSMNVGTRNVLVSETPLALADEVVPVSLILADRETARDQLVSSHMVAIQAYYSLLQTDVVRLLDEAYDREAMLESFTDQLEHRYAQVIDRIDTLSVQAQELQDIVSASESTIATLKAELEDAYSSLDYDRTEEIIDTFLEEREKNTFARTYLVFLSRFIVTYGTLNEYNKVLLDALINNKTALVKRATVVLPDSGTDILSQLELIQTEAEYKANQ